MLLQTNSYVVPRDRKAEHARLVRRFRQTFARLGCDTFEVYEQVGSNWSAGESSGRFVQIMRFRDRRHQLAVQEAERNDPDAQTLISEFCELINFPYQRQQGLFAVGFYISVLPSAARRQPELTDKTVAPEGEIDDESAQQEDSGDEVPRQRPAPAKPAALVEPGAATRAPIVTPIGPGQVPLVTPVEPGQVPLITPAPEEPVVAEADEAEAGELVQIEPPPFDLDDPSTTSHTEFAPINDTDLPADAELPTASITADSTATPAPLANPRWQTSDEVEDDFEESPEALSDVDENGQVRVADEELLQTEAEFAEYMGEHTAGAFEEIPAKPEVVEGTVIDQMYSDNAVPMNDDEALAALEMPDDAALPPINGKPDASHVDEHEGEIDDLPAIEHKTAPSQPDEVRH